MNFLALIQKALPIAIEAGEAILQVYHSADFEVEFKADHSPITAADKASNAILMAGLQTLTPDYPIISEEIEPIPYEVRQKFTYFWLLDPLDGTKEFVNRTNDFCVNVALMYHNRPIGGIVYIPCQKVIYFAAKDEGSFRKRENEASEKIYCHRFYLTDEGLRIPHSRSYLNQATLDFCQKNYQNPHLFPVGSAIKFLMVAEGTADIYPRLSTTSEWDTAAPQIIIEEAGGKLLQMDTHEPLKYNKMIPTNPHFLAIGDILD